MTTGNIRDRQNGISFNLYSHCFACLFCLFSILLLPGNTLHAEAGITGSTILLGQSCALSGPAKNLGLKMKAGLLAAIAEVNEGGGINGRIVRLRSRDDGYEPDRAIRNTLELIQEDQVFLLIGEVGTPTSKAVIPIIKQYRIPFFAPLTGAELLRKPFNPYVINIRGSYFQEMESLVAYFTETLGLQHISCFYQNDSYGFAGLEGIKRALKKRDIQLSSSGSYERNTVAVMGGLQDIYKTMPEAVILVGTYAACSEFIKLSKARWPGDRRYGNISFVGTESLKNALGLYGEDVIVSQVVPFPWDDQLSLVREYKQAMHTYQRSYPLGFISLEGYIAGKLFAAIAEAVPGELTREKFIQTLQKHGSFDLGGVALQFNRKRNQGMNTIQLTTIYPKIRKLENR